MSGDKRLFKILIFAVCAVMLLSLLSVGAFAAGGTESASGAFAAGGTENASGALLSGSFLLFLQRLPAAFFSAEDGVFFGLVIASVGILVFLFIMMRRFLKKK